MGLIGTKAGFATPLEEQLKQILTLTTKAIEKASNSKFSTSKSEHAYLVSGLRKQAENEVRSNTSSFKHDGRLDCLAGNGVMSELGVGLENDEIDDRVFSLALSRLENISNKDYDEEKEKVKSIPVVFVKNFDYKGADKDILFEVISSWAANLITSKTAHVIFVSDNVSVNKRLNKGMWISLIQEKNSKDYIALPNKPLNSISLSDADKKNSLKFVTNRLTNINLNNDDRKLIELIGGRVEDLEDVGFLE